MAAELLGWIVLEASVDTRHAHVGVCSDNSATVSWQMRGASKRSAVAIRLLRVLAIRLRKNRASPLVTRHLAGERNHLGDIPSRSFGYKKEWEHNEEAFLTFLIKHSHSHNRTAGRASDSTRASPRKLYASC